MELVYGSCKRECGNVWLYMVSENGEPVENHRPWMGDNYPVTCLDPDLNPGHKGDKRVRFHYAILKKCGIVPMHFIFIILL